MKNKIEPIHYHLDDFQFAQAKKVLAISKGVSFKALKDDMTPFIKLHETITVSSLENLKIYLPVVYWQKTSLLYGFIVGVQEDTVTISNIKGYPLEWVVNRKHILGQIKLLMPYWYFCWKLKRVLKSEAYKLKD